MKKCPSSTRCQDSNSQPLHYGSPPLTTRPGLSSLQCCTFFSVHPFLCKLLFVNPNSNSGGFLGTPMLLDPHLSHYSFSTKIGSDQVQGILPKKSEVDGEQPNRTGLSLKDVCKQKYFHQHQSPNSCTCLVWNSAQVLPVPEYCNRFNNQNVGHATAGFAHEVPATLSW